MHAIHIGIGGNNYLVVTESFDTIFYVQCCLKQVELFVLVYNFFSQSVRVKRLTA